MSIHTLTLDDFMKLTREDHEEAVDLYDQAISKTIEEARTLETDCDGFAEDRDKLGRLLTLRKVHQGCLDELDGEAPAPALVQDRFHAEVDQLPA